MITPELLDLFVGGLSGQPLREGTRYAREARVEEFAGTRESVTTVVRGSSDDYEVALWAEDGRLNHRCACPSWRVPCKHTVAAALVLRQTLPGTNGDGSPATAGGAPVAVTDPDESRRNACEERIVASRREGLSVSWDVPPYLTVASPSGFAYRVHLRADSEGPHSCDCPDFEANRLHTCKHVERVRRFLRSGRTRIPPRHKRLMRKPGIYLHFGEMVEPRLQGAPRGRGAPIVRKAFDENGVPYRPIARDPRELRLWLERFGAWTEPEAMEWLDARIRRKPDLPKTTFRKLIGPLRGQPYDYQWNGAEFLARTGRALLADEMGLGKTVQAILASTALRHARPPVGRVTIVCPASLRGGWREEIHKWLGEDDVVLLEGGARIRAEVIASRPCWLVTHYEQVRRDYRHHESHAPDLLIIDEAQRAKGLWTRTARVLKGIPARFVFALTGTPLENRLEEAYAIAQLLDQRLLPPLWQIDRDHFVREESGRRVVLYRNLDVLRRRLAPAFLRRRKEDVALQLPDRVRSVSMVPMHPAVTDTYDDVIAQVARIARKSVLLPADLERLQRLLVIARRCCNGPHMLGIDVEDRKVPKLAELEQVLRELCLGEGRKAVVFSEWTDMTERVEALGRRIGLPTFHLRGSVPVKRRPGLIRAFNETRGPALFVSTDSGGLGLNLQAADVVVSLDIPWNPARMEQRIARVHRIGSRSTTQEILFVTKDAVEERILLLQDTKRGVLANVWAKSGEDVIAAPGGSGMFQEMVRTLLEKHRPGPDEEDSGAAAELPPHAADRTAVEERVVKGAAAQGSRVAERAEAAEPAPASPNAVEPEALVAAVKAVLPQIPDEQRRPLATVFRALAEALGG